jgi:hypothetical protein
MESNISPITITDVESTDNDKYQFKYDNIDYTLALKPTCDNIAFNLSYQHSMRGYISSLTLTEVNSYEMFAPAKSIGDIVKLIEYCFTNKNVQLDVNEADEGRISIILYHMFGLHRFSAKITLEDPNSCAWASQIDLAYDINEFEIEGSWAPAVSIIQSSLQFVPAPLDKIVKLFILTHRQRMR